ncbi:MAG: molybdenum cofactor biosynthesis protein MoaE [Rhodobiaceae bacterium]|nr:molybdenum cofactor biosynthesis protein MoaE [Rhodobiaceae bacterium]
MIRVQRETFFPESELAGFRAGHAGAGAMASFVGFVRAEAGHVAALELEHYAGFTESEIARIERLALERFNIDGSLVIHRFGRMLPGEPIVLVAAAAAHRKPALEAVDFLMDYLKTDAPFWKRETGPEGARWIEPTDKDRAARQDWKDENA